MGSIACWNAQFRIDTVKNETTFNWINRLCWEKNLKKYQMKWNERKIKKKQQPSDISFSGQIHCINDINLN